MHEEWGWGSAGILPAAFRILRGAPCVILHGCPSRGNPRFSGGMPENAAKMAALRADKEIKNQRKGLARRRSSSPLASRPMVPSTLVGSGTAVRLLVKLMKCPAT